MVNTLACEAGAGSSILLLGTKLCRLAQLIEHSPDKGEVPGLSPGPATRYFTVVQLVEQLPVKEKVAGSSPAGGAILIGRPIGRVASL